jgi:uncharacterized protein (TIRG00374 family)
MNKLYLSIGKILITVSLLAVVVLVVDFRRVGAVLESVVWRDMLTATAAYQLGIFVRAYRWQVLLRAQGMRTPYFRLVQLYYIGTFFNTFLPSGFGGDVVKTYELSRHTTCGATAVSTVLVDRLIGLAVLFAMALVALPFSWRYVSGLVVLTLIALIAGFAVALFLFLNRPLREWLTRHPGPLRKALSNDKVVAFYSSFPRYSPAVLLRSAAASLLFNITLIVTQVYLARGAGVLIPVSYFFIFVPILSSLTALPISIGGLGVREGGYMLLFGQIGVAYDRSVAVSLLFYAILLFTGLAGGLLYLWQSIKELKLWKEKRISKSTK